ncbi:uncharacterized protein [Blastocystis hominis]|uniref:Uncharacterized protein n=1 Tax=Blastocystis hominis TaxID=12968 RepID=D8M3J3_BLAHO|nr:uncharacterized protein [Blastocystis hominis]CBK22466.2 unnamed protein product [Blastocystis hominis]|eukprot:XP_012896514.1 uncharacterized protein [Blastocystis hominis]
MSSDNSTILVIQELAQLASNLRETSDIIEKLNNRVVELNQSMRKLERCYGDLTLPFQVSVYEHSIQNNASSITNKTESIQTSPLQ